MDVVRGAETLERLATLIESLPVPAAIALDPRAAHVRPNARFAELAGVDRDAYVAMTRPGATRRYRLRRDGRTVPPDEVPFARVLRGEAVEAERYDLIAADGTVHPVVISATTIEIDGAVAGALAVLHDIAAEVVTADVLRQLHRLTPALLFTASADGAIDFLNPRWADLVGTTVDELLADGWMPFTHPDDRSEIVAHWRKRIAAGKPFVARWRLRRSDGAYRWIEVRAEPAVGRDGAVERWYGVGIDVDAQERALRAVEFLARGGAALAAAGDATELLERLAAAALVDIADIAFFDLRLADGSFRRIVKTADGIPSEAHDAVLSYNAPEPDDPHPIARAMRAAGTIVVPHVDDGYLAKAVPDPMRRARWTQAQVRSLIVTPLVAQGRVLGALTLLRTRSLAPFEYDDQHVIEEMGRRAAIALENLRLHENARVEDERGEREFRLVADRMPQLMYINRGDDGGVVWFNARWYEYTGQTPDEALGYGWTETFHPADLPGVLAQWSRCVAEGRGFQSEFRMRGADGSYRWFLSRVVPQRDENGRVVRWYGTNTDIDAARRSAQAARAFAEIGSALAGSLDLPSLFETLMRAIVPAFGDWAFVTLADDGGRAAHVAAVVHADAGADGRLAALMGRRFDLKLGPGDPPVLDDVAAPAALNDDPAVREVLAAAAGNRAIRIPIPVGNSVRGEVVLCAPEGDEPADLAFYAELGRRIAPAIVNAEVYERERRVARSFQQAALPAQLPDVAGFRFSALYAAGQAEALVGGDWYDAFPLVDGRIVVSIGDVAGSGLQSAVTMVGIRQAIRGVAHVHADPELMLEAADRVLRADNPERFVTAFVGVIDPVAETISYRSAGHPAPLLRLPDGTVRPLPLSPGPPLGLRERDESDAAVAELERGAMLVFYTDGLVESTHDVLAGEALLYAAVAAADPAQPGVAAGLHDTVLAGGSHDDVAILTVTIDERAAPRSWRFDARNETEARHARDELVAALRAQQYRETLIPAVEIVFAELVGNLARHTPGSARVLLVSERGRHVLHVLDDGDGFTFVPRLPIDVYSESGRGLFLIAALAENFQVTRRPGGGSHARAVLRG